MDVEADTTAQDTYGYTPLHWAVKYDYDKIVEIFLQAEAGLNQRDTGGTTALDGVVKHENRIIVEMLLKAGSD